MQYRTDNKTGNNLSILGFGCMRFSKKNGKIDIGKAETLITAAINNGVNYFDTAYSYEGSEDVLGQVLERNDLRNKVFIATKLRLSKCQRYDDFDSMLEVQLERLRTDYIDYYLLHNLSSMASWKRLCDIGIEKWIAKKKELGQIRSMGFSFHGTLDEFLEVLEAYQWDLCYIQYNYANENNQAGKTGLKRASEKGLPIFIMEPLLGGRLAHGLPRKALDRIAKSSQRGTPAAWALRWLWNQKDVTVVMSGMNEIEQLSENLRTAESAVADMLTGGELDEYAEVVSEFRKYYKIPCTECNYCMPCPQKVNIPACLTAYNLSYAIGWWSGVKQYVVSTAATDYDNYFGADKCTNCLKCKKQCPQQIEIPRAIKMCAKRLEFFGFKAAMTLYVMLKG